MPAASYLQTSFLGGEWGKYYQGRMDDQRYRSAMAVCRNAFPLEEGAWTRRPGTRRLQPTRGGLPAILREFHFNQDAPYNLEFSVNHLRMWAGDQLVLTGPLVTVMYTNTASPMQITTDAPHKLTTGDSIDFVESGPVPSGNAALAFLYSQVWLVTVIDATNFTIADPVTFQPFIGTNLSYPGTWKPAFMKVLDFITPYDQIDLDAGLRVVQAINDDQNEAIILSALHVPFVLTCITQENGESLPFATFSLEIFEIKDGPYFDFIDDGSTITPSGDTGYITLSVAYVAWSSTVTYQLNDNVLSGGLAYTSLIDNNLDNSPAGSPSAWQLNSGAVGVGINGFTAGDVGRSIRLFCEPNEWNPATAYVAGNLVKFGDTYWNCLVANTNVEPDTSPTDWAISTTAAAWTYAIITAIISTSEVTALVLGGTLLYTNPVVTWQISIYSDNTGWPTNGCYHEGRLWLSGAQPNRYDGSTTDNISQFTPTGPDGTVADDNGIAETLNSKDVNAILWMISESQGIIAGTQAGEWLVQASALNDPLTPTSIQAHRVTKFGVQNIEPVLTPLAVVFVMRYGRRAIEYIADVYSGKFSGTDIALPSKQLTQNPIVELAYVQEATPVIWARTSANELIGCTYKRESPFGTQPASFSGWHRHDLGSGRVVESISAGPSQNGQQDSLMMITNNPNSNPQVRWVELMTDLMSEDDPIELAWFEDSAQPPIAATFNASANTVVLYGLNYLAGTDADVWGAGLDLGTLAVASDGTVTIPINQPGSLFTTAAMESITAQGNIYGSQQTTVAVTQNAPVIPDIAAVQNFPIVGSQPAYIPTAVVDWDGNLLVTQNTATGWLYSYNLSTAGQLAAADNATLGISVSNGMCIGSDGGLWINGSGTADNVVLYKFDPINFAPIINTGALLPPLPKQLIGMPCGQKEGGFVCLIPPHGFDPDTTNARRVYLVDGLTGAGLIPSVPTTMEDELYLCPGISGVINGTSYGSLGLLGAQNPSGEGAGSSTTCSLYSIIAYQDGFGNQSADVSFTGTINLSSVVGGAIGDATFASLHVNGFTRDSLDGNFIISFGVLPGTTAYASNYLCKVTPTGTVLWRLALGNSDTTELAISQSRINNGFLAYTTIHDNGSGFEDGTQINWINTMTGALVSTEVAYGCNIGASSWDYLTGTLIGYGNYTESAGPPATPVPNGSTPSTFSNEFMAFYTAPPSPAQDFFVPFIVGSAMVSQGQILRPIAPPETGAQNGPALGKTRRTQDISFLVSNAGQAQFGTDFGSTLHKFAFASPSGKPYALNVLYDGVYWDKIEDTYSFNSQPCWQVTRPYPFTVNAVEAFLTTADR